MAFLGIQVPREVAKSLSKIEVPGEKVPISEMHITLLHFGDNWPISELVKSLEATYDLASQTKPFLVKANTISCFPSHDGDSVATIALIESPELHKLRQALAKEFEKRDIDFSKDFKTYNPHITLSYGDKEIEDSEIETIEQFTVHELVLWGGDHGDDRIVVTFPLRSYETEKHSFLVQKADVFYKLANNPSRDYLTASYERRRKER